MFVRQQCCKRQGVQLQCLHCLLQWGTLATTSVGATDYIDCEGGGEWTPPPPSLEGLEGGEGA